MDSVLDTRLKYTCMLPCDCYVYSCCRYENPEIALNCGTMLRECVRHEPLAKIILQSEEFYRFFSYVEVSTFDIASDAFATFKDLLTKHKILCAQFLEANYDKVRGCPYSLV